VTAPELVVSPRLAACLVKHHGAAATRVNEVQAAIATALTR
jgi:hypothetical protein